MTTNPNYSSSDYSNDNETTNDNTNNETQQPQHQQQDILELIESSKISPELIAKMSKHSDMVKECYNVFKECYAGAMKPTYIADIVNGEVIETKPENILVSDPTEPAFTIGESKFQQLSKYCTKKLYKYQIDAIHKIRELELRGYNINKHTGKKLISNGWLLSLPIGSGKSLVFQFIALFYRDVPSHPIIISTDGRNVPDHDQAELKVYPFYYENCGYIEGEANAVITLTDYRQRHCTVILTHQHLLQQMQDYFKTDFPKVSSITNIQYALDIRDIKDINKVDILIIAATIQNVNYLSAMSYDAPFMRVIIDDYTSMPNIESFRQIRASSTLFVSGSGFNRSESEIPASYYTLKFMPVSQLTLVGKPEETYEGILRDSIATMELMGSSCKFSQYKFVAECEEFCRLTFHLNPVDLYPILKDKPFLSNYISLMFVLKNIDGLKRAIQTVEHDLNTINPKTNSPYLDPSRLKYYPIWKKMLSDPTNKPKPQTKQIREGKKTKTITLPPPPSNNPLYMKLFHEAGNGNINTHAPIIPDAICLNCGRTPTEHNGYGMIAGCCGAFYCSNCADSCCTHTIVNSETNERIEDTTNYYCCCCRHKNPRYYFNISKKKDSSVYSFNISNEYFDTSELTSLAFDRYFYMLLNGFKPLYCKGKPLNILNDIQQHTIDSDCFKRGIVPKLDKILPKDQLAILTLTNINNTLYKLKILPRRGTIIMFYGCPNYMQDRVKYYFNELKTKNNPNTAFKIQNNKLVQPISNVNLVFKSDVGQLIGLHENILCLINWERPKERDAYDQCLGRVLRLSTWGNQITLYIECSSNAYE